LRYARELRDDPEALKGVLVPTPAGPQIPLGQLAIVSYPNGPPMVQSEDGQLFGLVSIDVAGRSLGEFVRDGKRAIAARVRVPAGYRLAHAAVSQPRTPRSHGVRPTPGPARPDGGDRRRRGPPDSTEAHDRARDPVRAAADHVGSRRRRGRHEADRRPDAGRRDQLV